MNTLLSNSFFPIFAILAFLAVVLLVESLSMLWNAYRGPETKKIEQRLRTLSAGGQITQSTIALKTRMLSDVPLIERFLLRIPRIHQIDQVLVQSGLEWTVGTLFAVSFFAGGFGYYLVSFAGTIPALQWGVALCFALLPIAFISAKRTRRMRKMEGQLPDALDLIGRAMRAGHALPSGLHMVATEMHDPIAGEFRITHDEINFGIEIQEALGNLSARVPITDMNYFVVAVLIQREAGGNLTELLDNLAKLIRERRKFHAKVRVLTTEGRMSAWVLGSMPFGLAALLNWANHDFISVLWTDPAGILITKIVLCMMAVGAVWMYRLIKMRV
jgi:tight adherence protein B